MQPIERNKNKARALLRYLATQGVELPYAKGLEAIAVSEGCADWNTLAAELAQPNPVRFCPCCGSYRSLRPLATVFCEYGQFDGQGYETEGNGDSYECAQCGGQMVHFPLDAAVHRVRDKLVVVVEHSRLRNKWCASAVTVAQLLTGYEHEPGNLLHELRRDPEVGARCLRRARLLPDFEGVAYQTWGPTPEVARTALLTAIGQHNRSEVALLL